MSTSLPTHLAIVIDVTPQAWWTGRSIPIDRIAETLHVFVNAVKLDNKACEVVCLAVTRTGAEYLATPKDVVKVAVDDTKIKITSQHHQAAIPSGLLKAMCWLTKQANHFSRSQQIPQRIMLITATGILPHHLVHVMNVAFAAQKSNVMVDVLDCQFHTNMRDDTNLVQLCHLTKGTYYRMRDTDYHDPNDVTRLLLKYFLVSDAPTRRMCTTSLPRPTLDLRAVCSVHEHEYLDKGFVCSVCLSVFCDKCEEIVRKSTAKCSACESDIRDVKMPKLAR